MSDPRKSSRPSSRTEGRRLRTPRNTPVFRNENDERLIRSLHEFIEHEKRNLPEEGAEEQRYYIYRAVFNKVIHRATAFKRLLLTIKVEYDDIIAMVTRREEQQRTNRRRLEAREARTEAVHVCKTRQAQLTDRISILQRETAELQQETLRQETSGEHNIWIPGVTDVQSEDLAALDKHLERLSEQRDALLDRKQNCVSVSLREELQDKMAANKLHRDTLREENYRLKDISKRLKFVSERVCKKKEEEEEEEQFEDVLRSLMKDGPLNNETEEESSNFYQFNTDEPTGVDQTKHLEDYLDRFVEALDVSQFEEASLLAASSPGGVLRNMDTVRLFEDVQVSPPSTPPLLIFFQSLLKTLPYEEQLSEHLSLPLVDCALHHNNTLLLTHAVSHHRLTFSEALGDVLTEHAQKKGSSGSESESALCEALATVVYDAIGSDRKTALSMCRRGLIHGAAEFMVNREFTADDCMEVLCQCPSLSLLQKLTVSHSHTHLSLGAACLTLLRDADRQALAVRLLDQLNNTGVLSECMAADSCCSPDVWTDVSSVLSSSLNRPHLSRAILNTLLQRSVCVCVCESRPASREGAELMDHVLL